MALQFVPDEDVGLLVPRMSSCNLEDLHNKVFKKIFKLVLMSPELYLPVNHAMRTISFVTSIQDLGRWLKTKLERCQRFIPPWCRISCDK